MTRRAPLRSGIGFIALAAVLSLVVGCGQKTGAPAQSQPAAPAPSADAAKPAGSAPATAPVKPKLETVKIRLGISSTGAPFLPLYAADRLGYFKDEGLEVEVIKFQGGSGILRAMLGGQLEIGAGGFSEPLDAQIAGQDVKAFYGLSNAVVYQWLANKNIKGPQDLKGKKIAGGDVGTQPYQMTAFWLRKIGLNPEKDVQMINAGGSNSRVSALTSGQVEVAILSSPSSYVAERAGFYALGKLSDYVSGLPHDVHYAPQEFLTKNPETVKAFIRAVDRAIQKVRVDKEASVKILVDELKLKEEDAVKSWDELKGSFPVDGSIALDGVDFMMEMSQLAGEIKAPLPHDKVINFTFIKAPAKKS